MVRGQEDSHYEDPVEHPCIQINRNQHPSGRIAEKLYQQTKELGKYVSLHYDRELRE